MAFVLRIEKFTGLNKDLHYFVSEALNRSYASTENPQEAYPFSTVEEAKETAVRFFDDPLPWWVTVVPLLTPEEQKAMVQAVRDYAQKHYNEGGWDIVMECYSDKDILETATGAATPEEAIKRVDEVVSVVREMEEEYGDF